MVSAVSHAGLKPQVSSNSQVSITLLDYKTTLNESVSQFSHVHVPCA